MTAEMDSLTGNGFYFKPVESKSSMSEMAIYCLITYMFAYCYSPWSERAYGGKSYIDFYPLD